MPRTVYSHPAFHIEHPHGRERALGAESKMSLAFTVGKSSTLGEIELTEDELLKLCAKGLEILAIKKGVRL